MQKESKRTNSAKFTSEHEKIFACPVCQSSMEVLSNQSLICSNKHTFDFAKQGYLNLTKHSIQTKYSKNLFEARRKLLTEEAFFTPLVQKLAEEINSQFGDEISILDTGCGEGTHLHDLNRILQSEFNKKSLGVGIDLAKEGIVVAAKNYAHHIWAVADLANTPFKNDQFDVILNILSPSNYAEFDRVLKKGGVVIKVVPRSNYLKELRQHLFQGSEKEVYSNEETVDRFNENFEAVSRSSMSYPIELSQQGLEWLVEMTPLAWDVADEQIESFLNRASAEMTVDLDILIGKKT